MTRMEDLYPLILETIRVGKTFYFPIQGTSMKPMLKGNDVVGLKAIDTIKKGDIVLYRRENKAFVLHRIRKLNKDGSFNIVGDHQTGIEKNVLPTQMIAKVFSYKKKGKEKEYFLKGFRYKTYKLIVKSKIARKIFSWF